jgi:sulfate transport system substrate-binding protein
MRKNFKAVLLAGALASTLALAACGGDDSGSGGSDDANTLNIVGYSVLEQANKGVISAFQKTDAGKDVEFKESYGASGDQSRAVVAGAKADEVHLSLEPDVTRLVDEGLVADDWKDNDTNGICTSSVVVMVVRTGNPKNIKTWDDLVKPGVKVLTPNPFTSGAAKWNILAAYGQAARGGSDPQAGLDYVRELITRHVEVQDRSGREALQTFVSGDADVLLSYEYEATTAQKKGEDVDFVTPDDTIKINIDIATTRDAPEQARAFLDYVLSEPAQERFVDWGYRPVNQTVLDANRDKFPIPSGLFTIEDLGGWSRVNEEMFDVEKGSIAKIEEEAGVSTAK